jgi:hypothetical protein
VLDIVGVANPVDVATLALALSCNKATRICRSDDKEQIDSTLLAIELVKARAHRLQCEADHETLLAFAFTEERKRQRKRRNAGKLRVHRVCTSSSVQSINDRVRLLLCSRRHTFAIGRASALPQEPV